MPAVVPLANDAYASYYRPYPKWTIKAAWLRVCGPFLKGFFEIVSKFEEEVP